jgi:hypothetical protein
MNSSIAAAMMAPRRSAARSARLEAGFGFEDVGALAPARRRAGFGADFLVFLVASFVMLYYD